ncbi:hypothetical protein FOCC_FOCC012968, partial [Frankliniella occidentalis]
GRRQSQSCCVCGAGQSSLACGLVAPPPVTRLAAAVGRLYLSLWRYSGDRRVHVPLSTDERWNFNMTPPTPLCHNAARSECSVCNKADSMPCSTCRLDYYCSVAHQKRDWPRHKSSRIGRYLIATKDIPAGTVVLRDTAFPVPNYNTDLPQVLCAACCKVLSATGFTQCSLCGWPVCGDACGGGPGHRRECELQGNHKLIWRALGALKTYFGTLEHSWLRDLQSDYVHDATDKERSGWRTAARWLRGALGLLWLEEEDLVRAAARNDINAIGGVYGVVTQPTDPAALADTGAIFAGLSLLEHNCTPSCSASSNGVVDTFSTDDFPNPAESVIKSFEGQKGRADNFVTTTRLVRKGEHLSIDYLDDPLISTSVRRKRLRNWGFRCDCERCTDPSEFGLYLESACCASCSAKGSRHFLIFNEVKKIFICEGCGHEEVEDPAWIEQLAFSALLDKPDTGVVELHRFVERSVWPRGLLHATHSLVIEAKSTMVQFARPDHLLGAGGIPEYYFSPFVFIKVLQT